MTEAGKPTARERLVEELKKYAVISLYLWVCFAVILLNRAAILAEDHGTQALHYGIALVKALVLGKFILIGDMVNIGHRANHHPLLHRIIWKSVAFLVLLFVFKVLEEIIVGWFHHESAADSVAELFSEAPLDIIAPMLLMWLILVPMVTAVEIYRAVGADRFRAFMMTAGQPAAKEGD
ncbi:hypothetical protein F3N42_07350 [Marinihelvus fidelis]|uniref:Uncharacterized protein n=1 Tax=Marinihelvus fidelis TaxID=2613842 RepID=A0A5N0TAL5_9GAMM|nr:hypothetical protein [Marinihelvus fidelis]KAA9131980.1 hypothetical protein F3N42_07350 [Marinihelvus fidelis]